MKAVIVNILMIAIILKIYQFFLIQDYAKKHSAPDLLSFEDKLSKYKIEELLKLGSLPDYNLNPGSFMNFNTIKSNNTLRIGLFGDSFVDGTEIEKNGNLQFFLSSFFLNQRDPSIEVINFGKAGHGFQQSFLMWDTFGKRYDLDVVTFGPGTFWPNREVYFYDSSISGIYGLKDRFIIDNNGSLKQISPIGNNHNERLKALFGIIPSWTYLKYDRNLPAFWKDPLRLVGFTENPLYYLKIDPFKEAGQIATQLLRRVREEHSGILSVQVTKQKVFDNLGLNKKLKSDVFFSGRVPLEFPYGLNCHSSTLGQERSAAIFWGQITQSHKICLKKYKIESVDTNYIKSIKWADGFEMNPSLASEVSIAVFSRGKSKIGSLQQADGTAFLQLKNSYLFIKEKGGSLLDAIAMELNQTVTAGRAYLKFEEQVLIEGDLKTLHPELKWYLFEIERSHIFSLCRSYAIQIYHPESATKITERVFSESNEDQVISLQSTVKKYPKYLEILLPRIDKLRFYGLADQPFPHRKLADGSNHLEFAFFGSNTFIGSAILGEKLIRDPKGECFPFPSRPKNDLRMKISSSNLDGELFEKTIISEIQN